MIESATDLIKEASRCSDSASFSLSCDQQRTLEVENVKLDFMKQFSSVQTWFLRCAWVEKYKLLVKMLKLIKEISSLEILINVLFNAKEKATIYEECCTSTGFVYDKILLDNNRTLTEADLKSQIEAALEWFGNVLSESQKISILISLLRMSGGAMVRRIYETTVKVYKERTEKKKCSKPEGLEVLKNATEMPTSKMNVVMNVSLPDESTDKGRRTSTYAKKVDPVDINHNSPLVIEVENQRKRWKELVSKYRVQVEGKKPKEGKPQKAKKDKKSKKSEATKSKKSKKGKGKNKGDDMLDIIQMLPIWIVKKIFDYFDLKTLNKLKDVNRYWEFAIGELLMERATRKGLDKMIKKMQVSEDEDIEIPPHLFDDTTQLNATDKRLLKASCRGATLKKLQIPLNVPLVNTSIVTGANAVAPKSTASPFENYIVFPRNVYNMKLCKEPPCKLSELGIIKTEVDPEKTHCSVNEDVSRTSSKSEFY